MSFNFAARADSSDEDTPVDLSAWTSGAKRKRGTPPRHSSGFQAVNQPAGPPSEDLAMEVDPEPEPEPEPVLVPPARAPVAQLVPAGEEATVISFDAESSLGEDDVQEQETVQETAQETFAHVDDFEEATPAPNEDDPVDQPGYPEVSIPADELEEEDLDDVEDYTSGGDIVLFVLEEQEGEDGVMAYVVEFEDRHVEEVSLACDSAFLTRKKHILLTPSYAPSLFCCAA